MKLDDIYNFQSMEYPEVNKYFKSSLNAMVSICLDDIYVYYTLHIHNILTSFFWLQIEFWGELDRHANSDEGQPGSAHTLPCQSHCQQWSQGAYVRFDPLQNCICGIEKCRAYRGIENLSAHQGMSERTRCLYWLTILERARGRSDSILDRCQWWRSLKLFSVFVF